MSSLLDIENIVLDNGGSDRVSGAEVVVRHLKGGSEFQSVEGVEGYVPGVHSVYIETWGCSHNSSDSEYMAGLLSQYGYRVLLQGSCGSWGPNGDCEEAGAALSNSKASADVWLLNSCTVKSPAEDHFRNMISEAQRCGKKLVVAGCVPQGAPKTAYLKEVSVIGVHQIDRVVEVVEETLKGNSVQLYGKKREGGRRLGGASLSLPKIRKNPLIEILPVNSGCLNACTYCKTKHARGELGSYSEEEIIERVKQAFSEGVVEIWLTSEDLGAYGRDLGTSLPSLLEKVTAHIPAGCMLRLGMTNPPYILEHLHRIAAVLKHPRVYSFLHVPVQSGSNNVLGEMKREYTREDFCNVVDTLYSELGRNKVTIATDIICGFPTETEEDFEETFSLVDKYRFKVLFNNQFFPRPGTPAAKMERQATSMEVKKRTKRVHELFQSYEPYRGREGEEMCVLVTEESSDGRYLVGHNKAYEQVLIAKEERYRGTVVRVRVTETSKHSMKAEVVQEGVRDVVEEQQERKEGKVVCRRGEKSTLVMMTRVIGVVFLSFVILKVYTLLALLS